MEKKQETKKHQELKKFAHMILTQMGANKITEEGTITCNNKNYRIDVIGDFDNSPSVLVEVGNNQYDKINDLRTNGYIVMVIPYKIKIPLNESQQKEIAKIFYNESEKIHISFLKLIERYKNSLDEKVKSIKEYNKHLYQLEKRYDNIEKNLTIFKERFNSIMEKFAEMSYIKFRKN